MPHLIHACVLSEMWVCLALPVQTSSDPADLATLTAILRYFEQGHGTRTTLLTFRRCVLAREVDFAGAFPYNP